MLFPALFAGAFVVGAFLYRVRGGFLPTGSTQIARAIWCVPTGAFTWFLSGSPLWGAAAALTAWAGLFVPNDPWQRMETPAHALQAGFIGAARLVLLCAPLLALTHPWLLVPCAAIGTTNAFVYWLGWKLPERALGGFIDWHTAWGEALFGGLCWATLVSVST